DDLHCSFCGNSHEVVDKLIAGPGVYICNQCVDLCNDIIGDELGGSATLQVHDESVEAALARAASLHRSRQQVDREVAVAVRQLRARGVTWTRSGEAFGMTRQSAWERYSGEE